MRKQVELCVDEDPRIHRIAQSAAKGVWRKHRLEIVALRVQGALCFYVMELG